MGKVKQGISSAGRAKKGLSLKNHNSKSFKAGLKKQSQSIAAGKGKTFPALPKPKGTAGRKKDVSSSSSKTKKTMGLQINFALPPTCNFLVQTQSPDPCVACFEGPGVSIKLPIKHDAIGQKMKKHASKKGQGASTEK